MTMNGMMMMTIGSYPSLITDFVSRTQVLLEH